MGRTFIGTIRHDDIRELGKLAVTLLTLPINIHFDRIKNTAGYKAAYRDSPYKDKFEDSVKLLILNQLLRKDYGDEEIIVTFEAEDCADWRMTLLRSLYQNLKDIKADSTSPCITCIELSDNILLNQILYGDDNQSQRKFEETLHLERLVEAFMMNKEDISEKAPEIKVWWEFESNEPDVSLLLSLESNFRKDLHNLDLDGDSYTITISPVID